MKAKIEIGVRYVLALVLLVFGINKFASFLSMPAPPEEGGAFLGALAGTGYVFPAVGIVFIVVGILLAMNRAVGFALVLLAPMTVNILLYHLKFDVPGIGAGALVAVLQLILVVLHREKFASLFSK
jgi:putative oxidoreductase